MGKSFMYSGARTNQYDLYQRQKYPILFCYCKSSIRVLPQDTSRQRQNGAETGQQCQGTRGEHSTKIIIIKHVPLQLIVFQIFEASPGTSKVLL